MLRRQWVLPIKAILVAGSSVHTVFLRHTTAGCAQTFQTFPENNGTFVALIKKESPVNLLPFLLFAFVASITPGPTNILVLANSQHFGVKNTVPAIWAGVLPPALLFWFQALGQEKCYASIH